MPLLILTHEGRPISVGSDGRLISRRPVAAAENTFDAAVYDESTYA